MFATFFTYRLLVALFNLNRLTIPIKHKNDTIIRVFSFFGWAGTFSRAQQNMHKDNATKMRQKANAVALLTPSRSIR